MSVCVSHPHTHPHPHIFSNDLIIKKKYILCEKVGSFKITEDMTVLPVSSSNLDLNWTVQNFIFHLWNIKYAKKYWYNRDFMHFKLIKGGIDCNYNWRSQDSKKYEERLQMVIKENNEIHKYIMHKCL